MPDAVDRTRLPIRRPPFAGATERTLSDSSPDWSQASHVEPPEGAPNVLLVLIDDAGFGNPSTFGGPIETPNYTRLAENGLRYNRFHVTALCSPTRAALLTGRNHHRVGFGMVGEFSGPFPGYNATILRDPRSRRRSTSRSRSTRSPSRQRRVEADLSRLRSSRLHKRDGGQPTDV